MKTLERQDNGTWHCHTKLEKFDTCRSILGISEAEWSAFRASHDIMPIETIEVEGNMLVTAGVNLMFSVLTSQGGTVFSNANANIGVGNGTGTALAADTDLSGASKTRKGMRSGSFPSVPASEAVQFSSDFLSAEANYAWNEWGVFNAASAGTMLNHKYETLGTKASGGTWTLTVTISVT